MLLHCRSLPPSQAPFMPAPPLLPTGWLQQDGSGVSGDAVRPVHLGAQKTKRDDLFRIPGILTEPKHIGYGLCKSPERFLKGDLGKSRRAVSKAVRSTTRFQNWCFPGVQLGLFAHTSSLPACRNSSLEQTRWRPWGLQVPPTWPFTGKAGQSLLHAMTETPCFSPLIFSLSCSNTSRESLQETWLASYPWPKEC